MEKNVQRPFLLFLYTKLRLLLDVRVHDKAVGRKIIGRWLLLLLLLLIS